VSWEFNRVTRYGTNVSSLGVPGGAGEVGRSRRLPQQYGGHLHGTKCSTVQIVHHSCEQLLRCNRLRRWDHALSWLSWQQRTIRFFPPSYSGSGFSSSVSLWHHWPVSKPTENGNIASGLENRKYAQTDEVRSSLRKYRLGYYNMDTSRHGTMSWTVATPAPWREPPATPPRHR